MAPQESSTTVFVGGFSLDTTANALYAAFAPFGEILDLQLPADPEDKTKKHRGFAFVAYSTPEAATDAIDNMHQNVLPGVTNRGRVLKVNKAKPQKQKLGDSRKPVWANEDWIKEHGTHSVGDAQVGTPIAQEANGEAED
ncbi:hypothetical protein JCM10213_003594 [Rhodosporidiobolus nylandii]